MTQETLPLPNDDLPVDDWYDPREDGDDTVHGTITKPSSPLESPLAEGAIDSWWAKDDGERLLSSTISAVSLPPIVPYVRKLSLGDAGRDVIAVKRALSRVGCIKWGDFTPIWGEYAVVACKNFQKRKGLKQTGEYTFATHEALRRSHKQRSRTEWAYDTFSIAIMRDEDITPEERVMMKIVAAVDNAIYKRDFISYSQARPMPDRLPFPNLPYTADCSGFITWAMRSGGAPDPNYPRRSTRQYDGYGYTGTLWTNSTPVYSLTSARICDFVFYGQPWMAGGAAHIGMVRCIVNGVVYIGHHGSGRGPLNSSATYRKITGIRRPRLM